MSSPSTLNRRASATSSTMNDIEQSVTKLLLATKQLLEGLTQWSTSRISEQQVYDIFHSLTSQFAQAKRAFESADISMADLLYVPDDLRHCLIIALDEEPSTTALEHHLPTIRDVIIRLLQGLKRKQAQFRDRSEADQANSSQRSSRIGNRSSTRSSQPPPRSSERPDIFRKTSSEMTPRSSMDVRALSPTNSSRSESPSPSSSTSGDRLSRRQASFIQPRDSSPNAPRPSLTIPQREYSGDFDMNDPKTADALAALKRQENLARRSSVRRASALYRSTSNASTRSTGRTRHGSEMKEHVPPVPTLPEQDGETDSGLADAHQTLNGESGIETELDKLKSPSVANEQIDGNDLTPRTIDLYLKLGKQVKKLQYEGDMELSKLRMMFIEKFPHIARNDHFPAIYIFSPTAQISYELENVADVKHDSVLTLEAEAELEPSPNLGQNIAEQMNAGFTIVTKEMSDVKQELMAYLREVHDKGLRVVNTVKEEPAPIVSAPTSEDLKEPKCGAKNEIALSLLTEVKAKLLQVESIRRDMGVVRQLHDGFRTEMQDLMEGLREKSRLLKTQPVNLSSARKYVDEGKEELDKTAEDITKRLEDLQDTIDELKLDVTARKCRPSSTQMHHCEQEAKKLQKDIADLSEKIKTVKPMWKKTWEEELQNIVKEQQFLKEQEALLLDLEEDHAAILEVFGQLQKIREIQEKSKPSRREFRIAPAEGGHDGMNSVLKQVTTIDVDPQRRLRALNQAEKMRERELANRIDEFENELVEFVESKKLRMTGGAQEIERQRQKKNQNMLRQLYEKKKGKEKNEDEEAPSTEEELSQDKSSSDHDQDGETPASADDAATSETAETSEEPTVPSDNPLTAVSNETSVTEVDQDSPAQPEETTTPDQDNAATEEATPSESDPKADSVDSTKGDVADDMAAETDRAVDEPVQDVKDS